VPWDGDIFHGHPYATGQCPLVDLDYMTKGICPVSNGTKMEKLKLAASLSTADGQAYEFRRE